MTFSAELALMGGTNVVNTVRERVNIADDGGKPSSLRDLIADDDDDDDDTTVRAGKRNI